MLEIVEKTKEYISWELGTVTVETFEKFKLA